MAEPIEAPKLSPRDVLEWMAVTLPLLTAAGFICTAVILMSLFGEWGLSGMQLVTPQDIVVPGVMIGYLIVTILYLPFALAQFFSWFSTGDLSRRITRGAGWLLLLGAVVAALVVKDIQWRLLFAFLATSAGFLLLLRTMRSELNSTGVKARTVFAAILFSIAGGVWICGAFGGLFNQMVGVGLARGLYVIDPHAACIGRVLWFGERVIVLRCATGSEEIRVMPAKEDLRLGSERELGLASKAKAQ